MANLKQIITTTLISGFLVGCAPAESNNQNLSRQITKLKFENSQLNNENYRLHIDLINRDNPYGWELNGDAL